MSRALGIADLERHVEVLELATPITLERYTPNRGGAYVGWRYSTNHAGIDGDPYVIFDRRILLRDRNYRFGLLR